MPIDKLIATENLHEVLCHNVKRHIQILDYLIKHFDRLSKKAYSSEVIKALSLESTYFREHEERLKLISSSLPAAFCTKQFRVEKEILMKIALRAANRSFTQDILIVHNAKINLANSDSLFETHLCAIKILGLAEIVPLVTQSINENKDTITWLNRILQNVILPSFLSKRN